MLSLLARHAPEIQQRIKQEGVREREPDEVEQEIVHRRAHGRTSQHDEGEGERGKHHIHERPRHRHNGNLCRCKGGQIAHISGEEIETETGDLAAEPADHHRVATLVQEHRDRDQNEQRGEQHPATIFHGVVRVECLVPVADQFAHGPDTRQRHHHRHQLHRTETHGAIPRTRTVARRALVWTPNRNEIATADTTVTMPHKPIETGVPNQSASAPARNEPTGERPAKTVM